MILANLVHRLFSFGDTTHAAPSATPARAPSSQPSTPSPGTIVRGGAQHSMRRKLQKRVRGNEAFSIRQVAQEAWSTNADKLNGQRARGQALSYGDEFFKRAVNAAMLGVPALEQNETLAMAVVEQLYLRGPMPLSMPELTTQVGRIGAEIRRATEQAQRRNAQINDELPPYPYPTSQPPSYAEAANEGVQARLPRATEAATAFPVVNGRQLRSQAVQGGRDAATGATIEEYLSTLSEEDFKALVPLLFEDAAARQQLAAATASSASPAAPLPRPVPLRFRTARRPQPQSQPQSSPRLPSEPFNAASLRSKLTDAQREQAELLIPVAIRYPSLVGSDALPDPEYHAAMIETWRNAMELLVYYRNHPAPAHSSQEVDLIQERQRAGTATAAKLDEHFDWGAIKLRNTPGGGDCLVHALEEGRTGQGQSREQALAKRLEIAGMRVANPDDWRGNRVMLAQMLNDVDPQDEDHLRWEHVLPEKVPNHLLGAFQACARMYSGTDMIVQWTMLAQNRDKIVVAIDAGHVDPHTGAEVRADVMAYCNGERFPLEGTLTNAKLDTLLANGYIVIRNKDQHWQSLYAPD